MSNPDGKPRVGRRRLLAGVGASGLATAIAVFGRASAAQAYRYGCCNLIFRNNLSMGGCMNSSTSNHSYYVWYCAYTSRLDCSCCEHYFDGRVTGSAYQCYPT
ncbi:MAG TPA: hypothetical protein VF062_00495 [Candidatus Limnocylindrales bacterium]